MKRFLAAVAFLTRVPLPASWHFDAADVGRAAVCFPLIGAGLGLIGVAAIRLLALTKSGVTPPVAAILVVALGAGLTGAMHLDGLADMADGFGGGRSREDVLRIMRDHAVGAYGAVALVLLILVKVAALTALLERSVAEPYLIVAPMLGQWASVPLGCFLPYARRAEGGLGSAITDYVGWGELIRATALAVVLTVLVAGWRGVACWMAVGVVTAINGRWCSRRIGGVTGDTLGANTEICEAAVLVIATALTG
jgi:adenosylcobinamide-GDP ribazoletransferase